MPPFNAGELANILIAGSVSLVVAWITTILVNRQEKRQRQEDRQYNKFVRVRDKLVEDLKNIERNLPTPIIVGRAGPSGSSHTVIGKDFNDEGVEEYNKRRKALADQLADINAQIETFYKE